MVDSDASAAVDVLTKGLDELRAGYAAQGLAGRMGLGHRAAVVVVDLINGFTTDRSPFGSDLSAEVSATNDVIAAAREHDLPVIFTTIIYDPSLRDAGLWLRKITCNRWLVEGSEWVELDPRLDRRPGDTVVTKKYASCFFGTDLMSQLRTLDVDTVLITGTTTSGCVRATAVDACSYGLHTIVVSDAVADRSPLVHLAALFDIDSKYADVMDVGALRSELEKVAIRADPTHIEPASAEAPAG